MKNRSNRAAAELSLSSLLLHPLIGPGRAPTSAGVEGVSPLEGIALGVVAGLALIWVGSFVSRLLQTVFEATRLEEALLLDELSHGMALGPEYLPELPLDLSLGDSALGFEGLPIDMIVRHRNFIWLDVATPAEIVEGDPG